MEFTKSKFTNDVIVAFKRVRPTWMPPHLTIFRVARKYKIPITIDGKTEAWWTKHWDKLFNDLNDDLETPKVRINNKLALTFEWLDCGSIRLKG